MTAARSALLSVVAATMEQKRMRGNCSSNSATPERSKCWSIIGHSTEFFEASTAPFRRVDVDLSSYLNCVEGVYRNRMCSDTGRTHFSATALDCVDPANMTFHAQGTSGRDSLHFGRTLRSIRIHCDVLRFWTSWRRLLVQHGLP